MGLDGLTFEQLRDNPRLKKDFEDIMGADLDSFSHLPLDENNFRKKGVVRKAEVVDKIEVNVNFCFMKIYPKGDTT